METYAECPKCGSKIIVETNKDISIVNDKAIVYIRAWCPKCYKSFPVITY
jgi:C4-type Zn-finger protein